MRPLKVPMLLSNASSHFFARYLDLTQLLARFSSLCGNTSMDMQTFLATFYRFRCSFILPSHCTFFTCSFAVTLTPQSSSGLVTSREFYLFHVFSFLLLQFLRFSQLPIRAARIPQIVPPACAATVRSGHIHSAGGISSARSSCAFG